jgi:transposase
MLGNNAGRPARKEEPMALYCGVDLHANNSYVVVLDEEGSRVVEERRLPNDLGKVLAMLEPYRGRLAGIAVESTWNWYWLVDGLMSAGYRLHLTNTSAVKQYEGLKHSDDRHDARWLAHLLALGILPEGYIYPRQERPIRDLCRRRAFLVRKRTSMLLSARGAFECQTGQRTSSDKVRKWTEADLEKTLEDPDVRFGISVMLAPLQVFDAQIKALEKRVLSAAKLRSEFEPLLTVWGIGRILGHTVMYEVGDIRRFPTVGDFASYCRCVKSDRLSNGKRKGSGNAKNGNPYLSWAFTEAAHFANRYYPPAQKFFQRKKAKRNAIVANRALAHKLARASYYVMRDGVDFDPERAFK